jgi:hypothetical protein
VFTVYSFRSKNDSCLTFKNVENVGATELIKDENENHFKKAIKAKKGFNKKLKNFVWKK